MCVPKGGGRSCGARAYSKIFGALDAKVLRDEDCVIVGIRAEARQAVSQSFSATYSIVAAEEEVV